MFVCTIDLHRCIRKYSMPYSKCIYWQHSLLHWFIVRNWQDCKQKIKLSFTLKWIAINSIVGIYYELCVCVSGFFGNGKWWAYYIAVIYLLMHTDEHTFEWQIEKSVCNEWMWSIECIWDYYYLGLMWRTVVARNMFDGHECGLAKGTVFSLSFFLLHWLCVMPIVIRDYDCDDWWLMIIIFAGVITHAKCCEKMKIIVPQIPAKLVTISYNLIIPWEKSNNLSLLVPIEVLKTVSERLMWPGIWKIKLLLFVN